MTPIKKFGIMLAAFILIVSAPLAVKLVFLAGAALMVKDYVIKKYPAV